MGFSVISLIEIIYFLSLRPYCAKKRAEKSQHFEVEDAIFFKNRNNIKNTTNKATFIGKPYLSEYYERCEIHHSRSFYKPWLKLTSGWIYIRSKVQDGWRAIWNFNEKEVQVPYPYFN
jgi:hypothetical protein